MTHLYELTAAYEALLAMTDADEDIAGGSENMWAQALVDIQDGFAIKVDGIGQVILTLEAEATTFRAESTRMSLRARQRERQVAFLKGYLKQAFGVMQKTAVSGLTIVRLQPGRGRVEVVDLSRVPEQYLRRFDPEVDKKAVLEAYKREEIVPGTLVSREPFITVR